MTGDYERYVVAWNPGRGSRLAKFGIAWTGWCPESGTRAESSERCATGASQTKWIGSIARSGLHALICPPFELAPRRSAWALDDAVQMVARAVPAIALAGLQVEVAGNRVVLAPKTAPGTFPRLARLVGLLARAMERMPNEGVPQRVNLGSIAVPLSEGSSGPGSAPARFEIPLTETMPAGAAERLAEVMRGRMTEVLAEPQRLGNISLLGDPGEGRPWRLLERYPLSTSPVRAATIEPAGMSCPGLAPMPPVKDLLGSTWNIVIV